MRSCLGAVQEAGWHRFGGKYRSILPLSLAFYDRPLWEEDGVYATQLRPWLPPSTLFLGAFLQPPFLADRYGLWEEPRLITGAVRVRCPGTRILNLKSKAGCASYMDHNLRSFALLAADLIIKNIEQDLSTVLVGRKGHYAVDALKAVATVLAERGFDHVRLEPDRTLLPAEPDPTIVPFLTYGVTGLNSLEQYNSAIFVTGFYVDGVAVRDTAFGHLPPSQRPLVEIKIKAGQRMIEGDVPRLGEEDRERVWHALIAMEIDVVLQAFHRLRPAIHPRTIVLSCCHDLEPFLGPVEEFMTVGTLRQALGLPRAVEARGQLQWNQIVTNLAQGMPMVNAAAAAGIPLRTAWRLHQRFSPDQLALQDRATSGTGIL
jgi:hypothetical protein